MPHNLIIVRTAFQGWLARQVLNCVPEMSYDLLQISYNDAAEERHQFDCLAKGANRASFLLQKQRRFDFLNHIDLWQQLPAYLMTTTYDKLFLASIDAPVIGAIASRHKASDLITWDDGIANLVPDGYYNSGKLPWRSLMLRRALKSASITELRDRIENHFTIFGTFPNIAPPDRVTMIQPDFHKITARGDDKTRYCYLIGQPLEEVLSPHDIGWVAKEAITFSPDWYVKHPRENNKFLPNLPELEKSGEIAEEAIMRSAAGRSFELVGCFSSTLFTLSRFAERTTMILPKSLVANNWLIKTGKELGINILTQP